MRRVRAVIRGRVQGVGFRYSISRRASERGVAGWVTNRSDGAVEAVFEGDDDALAALVSFCREGPRGASVEGVDETEEDPEGLESFDVR